MSTPEQLNDLLQSDAATGRGQEQGVEARGALPPATLDALGLSTYKLTYVEVQPLRRCKASGLRYYIGGGAGKHVGGCVNFVGVMGEHYLYPHQTKRAEFCGDQCRNLWRDTKKRREAGVEV